MLVAVLLPSFYMYCIPCFKLFYIFNGKYYDIFYGQESSTPHAKARYSELFLIKIRSDDGLFDRPNLVTLKLMHVLCKTVF